MAAAPAGPDVAAVTAELLQDVRVAQNLLVLRTSPGNANALAVALDKENWPEIVGTIAGDDTILSGGAAIRARREKLRAKLLGYVTSS